MNKRMSLANPLVEKLRSPSGPIRRRSSIALRPPTVTLVDNDDEAERAALRLKSNNASAPSPPSSKRRSFHLNSVIGGMSSPEIAEGIAECIKLNTQNKINMKNAFSLNMIDFMSYLVRNRDEGISNLQVAGTTLDVSAKIYALRVDALHHDILKMAGNLDHKDKADGDDNNGNEENANTTVTTNDDASSENNQRLQKKKKRKISQKIRTTLETLIGDVESVCLTPVMFGETDCQTTDMLYQAMLPQHCGIGLGLHPYKDIILDDSSDSGENNISAEPRISWPPVQFDLNREIITMYPDFEFLNWNCDQECDEYRTNSEETPSLITDDLAFDLDDSLPADDVTHVNRTNFYDMDDVNEDNTEGFHAGMQSREAIVDCMNIVDRLPNKKMEYSFFSDVINIRWVGPAHWKIKTAVKNLCASKIMEACPQGAGRKKKELLLAFSDATDNCDASFIVPKKSTAKLQVKTARITWSEKKLELPRENHDDALKKMCQFMLRSADFIKFTKNTDVNATILSDGSNHYDYENENDTTNYYPNVEDDDIPAEVSQNDPFNMDVGHSGFVGDNLIEAPKLTQKIFIPFSQRARKLDMRRLKKCIWSTIAHTDEITKNKENVETADKTLNNIPVIKENIKFSDVVLELPKKLSHNDAEELNYAIAFVSLLHLANEKSLKVISEDDFSDIIISQDAT